ncbi:MAG: DUF6968 family protein [Devosia sp.]
MVIGTRMLVVQYLGEDYGVPISLFLPEQIGQSWDCRYEIGWPDGTAKSFAGGNDAIAAIFAAIEKIGMELHLSRYHHQRTMSWMPPWEGYGFPLPKGARDELIGDDQRFYGLD